MNTGGSSYQSTANYINHVRNPNKRLDNALLIHTELVAALKQHGCRNCLQLLREIIKKYSGVSDSTQISLVSKGDGPFDAPDNRK
jgi:hypothetical protein